MKPNIIEHSELMKEWDWGKNNVLGLSPYKLTQGSGKKAWWICKNSHSWEATISSRVFGNGCKYCAGQAVTPERSLATKYPDIAKEWDYERNNNKTLCDYSYASSKECYWICSKCGRSYKKRISDRTLKGVGCAYCRRFPATSEEHNLLVKYPEIAKEWDYNRNSPLRPENIAPQTAKKYWWICSEGHNYEASPNNRVRGKSKCGTCYLLANSLSIINPTLAKEWHPTRNNGLTANDVTYGCNNAVWWLCPICGYEWKAKINNRHKGRGCPDCSKGLHTSFSEQALFYFIKQIYPDAISQHKIEGIEVDIYIPSHKIALEYDGCYYHNTLHKIQKDTQKNIFLRDRDMRLIRVREDGSYPMNDDICKIIPTVHTADYKYLQSTIETVLQYLSEITKTVIDILVNVDNVKNYILKEMRYVKYDNSFAYFAKVNQDIKTLWDYEANHPLTPEMVSVKSSKKAHWICKNNPNHKWVASIASISNGTGCDWCANRHQYTTDEWVKNATEAHNGRYNYDKVKYINSKTKVIIVCAIHGEFEQMPSQHLIGNGCPWCAGQGGYHKLNVLATVYPNLAKEWDYEHIGNNELTPNDVLITDNANNYWWKCNNGHPHSYKAKISARIRGVGCAVCHGKQISYDRSLECLRPDLVAEWDKSNTLKPSEVTLGSEKIVTWKCLNPDHPLYQLMVAGRVVAKYGCQLCSGRKKNHQMFAQEIADKFPHIELLTKYERSNFKVRTKCRIYDTERLTEASKLLKGKMGCKKCGK